jgi:hypothetical protein
MSFAWSLKDDSHANGEVFKRVDKKDMIAKLLKIAGESMNPAQQQGMNYLAV